MTRRVLWPVAALLVGILAGGTIAHAIWVGETEAAVVRAELAETQVAEYERARDIHARRVNDLTQKEGELADKEVALTAREVEVASAEARIALAEERDSLD